MNKRSKIKICIILSILLASGFLFYLYCNQPERVIKNYINSITAHNINDVVKYRTSRYGGLEEGSLDYIDHIELIDISPITDDISIDEAYLHRIKALPEYQKLSKNDFKIYKVTYYLKVKDNIISPVDSGNFSKSYVLIKENNKWKIDSMEEY